MNNNGHDITIVPNTTILFSNTSARIVMNGGSFNSGSSSESYPIYLNAKSGTSWKGLKLGNCEEVEIHQTRFEGISPYPVDSTYAVELTDCSSINISNCVFSASSTGKKGSLMTESIIYSKTNTVMLSLTKHDLFKYMMSPFVKLRVTFPITAKDSLQAGTMPQQAC